MRIRRVGAVLFGVALTASACTGADEGAEPGTTVDTTTVAGATDDSDTDVPQTTEEPTIESEAESETEAAPSSEPPAEPVALPVSAEQLMNAWIPPVCGHEAGQLVDGVLPVADQLSGFAKIAGVDPWDGSPPDPAIVIGDVTGDGVDDGMIDIYCSAGGVPWPSVLVFYTNGGEYLGAAPRSEVVENPGRGPADELTIRDGRVNFSWYAPGPNDGACCPTRFMRAQMVYDGGEFVVTNVQMDPSRDRTPEFYRAK